MALVEESYRIPCIWKGIDYKKVTKYSDEEIVIQMRLSMNVDLKSAIDTHYGKIWNILFVDNAARIINELINHISYPAVYREVLDHMKQLKDEPI